MKEDKEIEKILLNDENYDKFINLKNEKDFNEIIKSGFPKIAKEITDIKRVPSGCIFSKDATYLVINKESKSKSYINGVQAEGFLAGQNLVRDKLKSGLVDSFVSGNCYIKFYKYKSQV